MSDPADDLNVTPKTTGHLLAELIAAVHGMREEMRQGFDLVAANVNLAVEESRRANRRITSLETEVNHLPCSEEGGNGKVCELDHRDAE
jgi:hypothetical protein